MTINDNNNNATTTAAAIKAQQRRAGLLFAATRIGLGISVVAAPISYWWYNSIEERKTKLKKYKIEKERQDRLPESMRNQDSFGIILSSKCLPGDVILFDKRVERCCASPWAALSCYVTKVFLCNINNNKGHYARSVESGAFDHMGIVVPGYVHKRSDEYDPSNLLLLEATPSGLVARNLRERIDQSSSRSLLLVQLAVPGEIRDGVGKNPFLNIEIEKEVTSKDQMAMKVRKSMEKELAVFRDNWVNNEDIIKKYPRVHSTITILGALAYGLGLSKYYTGPTSPSAYVVLRGLQQCLVAAISTEKEDRLIKVEDFLRNHRLSKEDAVRLRPGYRFLAPIPLRDN
jgi:hypothetical protein